MRSVSSLSPSWAPFMCADCAVAVGSVGVVVATMVEGLFWLFESATHKDAFHGVPLQAVVCRSEPSHVICEIVVVAVHFNLVVDWSSFRLPIFGWSTSFLFA